jgi:CheY-like chemotaxis protein
MRTLLLADDSITVQRVIALTFAEEPISVVTVGDGRQAMERLAVEKPDIVLAGTTLPHVSGYELARFMRSRPELQHVPVLLLSGAFESVDTEKLKASGANGVLEKPVEPTVVIGRVKELLGLKADAKPATAGRLVTSPGGPTDRKSAPAHTPPSVTSTRPAPSQWDQLRDRTGLDLNTRSVEDPATRADDYLDTLDEAFDSLDRQISGRAPKQQRNPSGPLGQSGGAADPRSPGRRPAAGSQAGNPVFEVDDEWFGAGESPAHADARAGRREIVEDLRAPELQSPIAATPADPIYEVDDEWFKEDEKARALRAVEQQQLAAEMGLHEMDLAPTALPTGKAADDLNFSLDDLKHLQTTTPAAAPPVLESTVVIPAPVIETPRPQPVAAPAVVAAPVLPEPVAPIVPLAPIASPAPVATARDEAQSPMADDFAALLAFEQGEQPHPPVTSVGPEIKVVAPEITDEMLDQIAARVADRLSASAFGDQLKESMSATMRETVRDTVRSVVSETSERLVREEIDRIKSKNKPYP